MVESLGLVGVLAPLPNPNSNIFSTEIALAVNPLPADPQSPVGALFDLHWPHGSLTSFCCREHLVVNLFYMQREQRQIPRDIFVPSGPDAHDRAPRRVSWRRHPD